ncbi:MAG: hypothetical protein JWP92_2887 [Caulobacter sp.]|nr:hypothetical protein [Caulobacter sp.]
MRPTLLASALAVAVIAAAPALAAPTVAKVNIAIGPELAKKGDDLGTKEFDYLTTELRRAVERQLAQKGALSPDGGALNLVIADAQPNRPTFEQLGAKPGLSFSSFGIGGASISGDYVSPSGVTTPVSYRWYETDIRETPTYSTWHDADVAFDRFALRLGRDRLSDD